MKKHINRWSKDMHNTNRKNMIQKLVLGKIYLINPKFQYKFMAYTILSALSALGIVYAANQYFFHRFIEKGKNLHLPVDHPFYLIIQEQQSFMSDIFVVVSISVTLFLGIWGLFFSHRIAGPLYRLNKIFKSAAKDRKELKAINFREHDFFQDIPEAINLYLKTIDVENKLTENKKIKDAS
jgi:hypothetical protein